MAPQNSSNQIDESSTPRDAYSIGYTHERLAMAGDESEVGRNFLTPPGLRLPKSNYVIFR